MTPVQDGVAAVATRTDPALVKARAQGFRYQRLLDVGRYTSISEMAAAERTERGFLGTLLRLTLLAPNVVDAHFGQEKIGRIWVVRSVRVIS